MPMGVGQLFQTVFNCSLAIVRFMMNKSMDQKPEVNIFILFFLSAWAGGIQQILQSDWFRERAEFSHPARSRRAES